MYGRKEGFLSTYTGIIQDWFLNQGQLFGLIASWQEEND